MNRSKFFKLPPGPNGWDELDREISAWIRKEAIDHEVRRRMKLRHFRKEVLPFIVWGLALGASIGWLAWTIWG